MQTTLTLSGRGRIFMQALRKGKDEEKEKSSKPSLNKFFLQMKGSCNLITKKFLSIFSVAFSV